MQEVQPDPYINPESFKEKSLEELVDAFRESYYTIHHHVRSGEGGGMEELRQLPDAFQEFFDLCDDVEEELIIRYVRQQLSEEELCALTEKFRQYAAKRIH